MRFPKNTYKGEGTFWGKLNVIASQIWVSFFQIVISLLAYVVIFSGQLYFGRSYFFTFFQSNYFGTTVTFWEVAISSQQLLFSPFSEQSLFSRSYFSEQLLFRSEDSIEQPLLENRRFFTAVTVRNSFFFGRTVYDRDILKRATFSKQVLLHSINLFRKAIVWKKLIFQRINFRITYFFWRAVFFEQLF